MEQMALTNFYTVRGEKVAFFTPLLLYFCLVYSSPFFEEKEIIIFHFLGDEWQIFA